MIAKLTGILESIENNGIVIDVQGVGYFVKVSQKTLDHLGSVGVTVTLWIEQIFKQDHVELCGFLHKSERLCFRQLLSVQGVGVRVAMAILSVLNTDELILAIESQDKTILTRAEGVGPKLAGRLLLELKDRLAAPNTMLTAAVDVVTSTSKVPSAVHDALLGLINLGYSRSEAYQAIKMVSEIMGDQLTSSDLLRNALKSLAKL